ncbi:hypothetical protein [Terrimonas pollutisoli]|uniref:hypothetical protein n=1 Tax=Terrimonas pollutisoli TaxID=3034147 RepID=UPI0023EDF592|nr:hypothetical protein [Terrimonas sp. H1YJ31]
MKKLSLIAAFAFAATSFSFTTNQNVAPQLALADGASSIIVPVELFVFIPCAGETVTLTGNLHILTHLTTNGNNFVSKSHFQPQGISGVGDVSGDKYQATGVTQDLVRGSFVNGSFTYTAVNNFRIIGQGTGNNYLVHQLYHITITPNGIVSTVVDNTSIDCQ